MNARNRENTRARLLDAAEQLLSEMSLLSIGVDTISKRAGFTRGAFYSNFTTVDDLLLTLYERKTEQMLDAVPTVDDLSSSDGPRDLESEVDRALVDVHADPQWYVLRAMFALRGARDPEVAERLRGHAEELRRGLTPGVAGMVRAAGLDLRTDEAEATRILIAAHVGAVLQGPLVDDPEQLRRDAMLAVLRGVTVPPRSASSPRPGPAGPADGSRRVLYALTTSPQAVHRLDLADGEINTLADGLPGVPDGIVIDPEAGEAVITLMGVPDGVPEPGREAAFRTRNGAILAVPLSGGTVRRLVEIGTFTTGKQLTRDASTGWLYWCDREGCGVYRCERDGSGVTPLVLTSGRMPTPAEDECVGIAVDTVGGWLYWTQKGPSDGGRGRILRARLDLPDGVDPASRDDIEVLWEGLPEPIDLELDLAAGMITWTDRGAEPDGNTLNRAPIPGPGEKGERPQILARGFAEAIGVALDQERGLAYVSDLGGTVQEIDLVTGARRTVASFDGGVTGIALGER